MAIRKRRCNADQDLEIYSNTYSKTCLKQTLNRRPKLVLKTDYSLIQVKRIAEPVLSRHSKED